MRFIIVGGDGFLGRHVAKELRDRKQDVVVFDLRQNHLSDIPGIRFEKTDIRNPEEVNNFPFRQDDTVIHVASVQYHERVPHRNRLEYFKRTNCNGTQNVVDAMEKHGCRKMIYFSTDMVYGKPRYLPVDTQHPQSPIGPYGESKKISETICRTYRERGFAITIFRPRLIVGPGRLGILERLFWLLSHNLPIPVIGKGDNCYQMISVLDCVQAIMSAVEKNIPNGEYNLGSKNPPTVKDLLNSLISHSGYRSSLVFLNSTMVKSVLAFLGHAGLDLMYKEQYEIADVNYIVDTQKTEIELGWSPQFSDEEMLFESFRYYQQLRSQPSDRNRGMANLDRSNVREDISR